MHDLITADTIANQISMLRMTMRGPIVLVEGKTDTRVYRRFFLPAPHVRVIYCNGKPILREAMAKVHSRRMHHGVVGICDADYERLIGQHHSESTFYADWHDAEIMICHSDAFDRVLEELLDREPAPSEKQAVRNELMKVASTVGAIRLWNEQNRASLKFHGVDIGKHLLDRRQFDIDGYVSELLDNSPYATVNGSDLISVASSGGHLSAGAELASGHDFCALLASEVRRVKSDDDTRIESTMVEAMLRLSFDSECFAKTELAVHLSRWEQVSGMDLMRDEACPAL
ncbi:DUF4435 domain-containing protein [Streptomyces sp. HNM0663]|uniref:DUF4435 domain-containing protein n=1 Tax=Streptomyces chengmaiensis TaxID=3040919 RepID=A0ABT6HJR1_9ACTN|nr:DUF4435 domain-containing protein [Streptomyces chengmaiensis]MDH2388299.1 DUF4435 domain-containing protein [Streptomyces chengmaiensis]